MSRDAYLAATKGGTDRAAARAFSNKAQRSYSSQQNNSHHILHLPAQYDKT